MKLENVIIIGSGPGPHPAAIYTGRARLDPMMFEGFMAGGVAAGGQLTTTTEIENFPGFPDHILGSELMARMREQSIASGCHIETKTVTSVNFSKKPFEVYCDDQSYHTQAVIIATGATAKRLKIPGENVFWQKGISACAVCDGALPLFRNNVLGLIGGGDTACEEALYLTKFASQVLMFVRRNVLRASQTMQERVFNHPKIKIVWETRVIEAKGGQFLEKIVTESSSTTLRNEWEVKGLFYAIGHQPNIDFLKNQVAVDEAGYILTKPGTTQTNVKGIFACGDVQDRIYRQAVTAAGSGCMAALEVDRYLKELN